MRYTRTVGIEESALLLMTVAVAVRLAMYLMNR